MKEKQIGVPNEAEYYGKGVSYCAVCDGALYKNRTVVVVGGGNSAVEEAIYLSDIVKEVHVIHRRNEFRADSKIVQNMRKIKNIIIHTPCVLSEIVVNAKTVSAAIIEDVNTKVKTTIETACIFPYIGLIPLTSFVDHLNIVNDQGFIMVNDRMMTSYPGLYAGGDVIVKSLRQVATAINDGAIAAIEIKNYLSNHFDA